jgi:hypothetical protein
MEGDHGGGTCASTIGTAKNLKLKMTSEPVLDGVLEEDRVTVRNIIYVLYALKLCSSWSVTPKNQGYEVTGLIDTKTSSEVELRDMELIKRVDPLRISSVSARVIGGQFSVVIALLRKSEPVVLEEQEIVQIQRKRKFWWNGFG